MAEKTSKKPKKEKPDGPVTKKHLKESRLLLKGVKKFIRYNDDLISDKDRGLIEERETEFREAMADPEMNWKKLEKLAGDLTETCKKSVPSYQPSALKENIEVIFVAVVIAMGIRAYFAQPFKIPTGSMQPTLNGVIAYADEEVNPRSEYSTDQEMPGFLGRIADKIWYGRSWANVVAEKDGVVILNSFEAEENRPIARFFKKLLGGKTTREFGFREETHFKFFTRTYIPLGVDPRNPSETHSIPGTISRVKQLIDPKVFSNPRVQKDQVIARGYVDTGDQVIVDKFTYHWRRPKRGEVFVFNTQNIDAIQRKLLRENPEYGSQHYIKRLAGTPGDRVTIKPPELWINGERAVEEGFQKVMSQQNGYEGYSFSGVIHDITLGPEDYWALGDNTNNSSDSRVFGTVPAKDIVGRACFVYLPFGHHWGSIR